MDWNSLKNKFREKKYSTRIFFRGIYMDFLRLIFSRWFIRNRWFFISIVQTPLIAYALYYEGPEYYEKIMMHRNLKKDYVAEKLLHERGLNTIDEDNYKHYSEYIKTIFPR